MNHLTFSFLPLFLPVTPPKSPGEFYYFFYSISNFLISLLKAICSNINPSSRSILSFLNRFNAGSRFTKYSDPSRLFLDYIFSVYFTTSCSFLKIGPWILDSIFFGGGRAGNYFLPSGVLGKGGLSAVMRF